MGKKRHLTRLAVGEVELLQMLWRVGGVTGLEPGVRDRRANGCWGFTGVPIAFGVARLRRRTCLARRGRPPCRPSNAGIVWRVHVRHGGRTLHGVARSPKTARRTSVLENAPKRTEPRP